MNITPGKKEDHTEICDQFCSIIRNKELPTENKLQELETLRTRYPGSDQYRNKAGRTPLSIACEKGDAAIEPVLRQALSSFDAFMRPGL